MQLNIIGNGFDLYHGLPSSYYFFGCYLIKNDPEFYEEIGKMYNFKFRKMVGPPIAHDYEYVVEDIFLFLIILTHCRRFIIFWMREYIMYMVNAWEIMMMS